MTRFGFRIDIPQSLVEQGYTVAYFTEKLNDFERGESYSVTRFKKYTDAVDIKPFISSLKVVADEAIQAMSSDGAQHAFKRDDET